MPLELVLFLGYVLQTSWAWVEGVVQSSHFFFGKTFVRTSRMIWATEFSFSGLKAITSDAAAITIAIIETNTGSIC